MEQNGALGIARQRVDQPRTDGADHLPGQRHHQNEGAELARAQPRGEQHQHLAVLAHPQQGGIAGHQDGDGQREIENLGAGEHQDQRDAEEIGLMPHGILEHPGEILGQEDRLDQHNHCQCLARHAFEKVARVIALDERLQHGPQTRLWGRAADDGRF